MPRHAPNVRLRHLRVLTEIVQQGSLVGASQTLHVTQAAISKSLAELETEIGAQLLERSRSAVKLTPAGEAFHAHAIDCLISHGRAIASVRRALADRGELRFGALPTAAASVVPEALRHLKQEVPGLRVKVRSGTYEQLTTPLRQGEIEMIVGRVITRDTAGLAFEELYQEPIVLVVRPEHPLAKREALSLAEIFSVGEAILPDVGSSTRQAISDFLFIAGLGEPELAIETLSDGFARTYAAQNDAVWFTPRGTVCGDLSRGTLVALPVRHSSLQAVIGLTLREGETLLGNGLRFATLVRQIGQDQRLSS